MDKTSVLSLSNLTFNGLPPIDFSLDSGEIGLLQDENYRTGACIRDCFLGNKNWDYGTFLLDGLPVTCRELRRMVGTRIAVQIAMPDRTGGVLFDNLSALENLSTSLIPKAGKRFLHKHMMDSILDEAAEWFDKDALLKPISTWSMPERLRLSYFKWYLMNPKVLICLFPFLGQESIYHEMIIDLLVLCARRGIAVWVISSGIHTIHEKTRSREFLERVRFLD
jgi:ABC-type sugar transport system ATPase subunit